MAGCERVETEPRFVLDLSRDEAEMILAALGSFKSMGESEPIYQALRNAGVARTKTVVLFKGSTEPLQSMGMGNYLMFQAST
jgi:hypothetical protein